MPDAATELQTPNDFLEHTWRNCRAVDADYRWTVEDMTPELIKGANVYALSYTGTFEFMVQMRRQAQRGTLSAAQAKGVMNCMMAEVRRERQAAAPRETVDMSALMTLFRRAGTHLRNPRITLGLDVGSVTAGFQSHSTVTLKLMTRGSHPGSINIGSGSWPNGVWYGRVEADGRLTRGGGMTEAVMTLVRELAADPVAAAQRYAALTGNCCFCNLRLTDERSTQAGYGPVCAQHYGLPWGDREGRPSDLGAAEVAIDEETAICQVCARITTADLVAWVPLQPITGETRSGNVCDSCRRTRYYGAPRVRTPEGFTYRDADGATRVVHTPQVPALPGMTPLGVQAEAIIDRTVEDINAAVREAGYEVHQFGRTVHMCNECPAFGICQEQGQCNGGVVA